MADLVSIIVPLYNEELVLDELRSRLVGVMDTLPVACEVILVDDGSTDTTRPRAKEICRADPRFRLLGFSRNFGHQVALTAGLDRARGAAAVFIDADLQDPPELIAEMVARWKEGYQVVYGVRRRRAGESWFKLATAAIFYRVLRRLTDVDIPADAGDFRLLDRKVIDQLVRMRERARFVRGMVSWVGFRQCRLEYDRQERHAGETKYPFRKMLKFAIDGVLAFSVVPLKLASTLGFLSAGVSVVYLVYGLVVRLFFPARVVPGWTSIFVAVLFIGGVQLICMGIIGEYLGRIYDETRHRPLYICDEEVNLEG